MVQKHEDILGNTLHTGTKDCYFTLAELWISENVKYIVKLMITPDPSNHPKLYLLVCVSDTAD